VKKKNSHRQIPQTKKTKTKRWGFVRVGNYVLANTTQEGHVVRHQEEPEKGGAARKKNLAKSGTGNDGIPGGVHVGDETKRKIDHRESKIFVLCLKKKPGTQQKEVLGGF